MSFQILIWKYLQNSCHHFVTNLIKLAPLRPGLVRLAIFFLKLTFICKFRIENHSCTTLGLRDTCESTWAPELGGLG